MHIAFPKKAPSWLLKTPVWLLVFLFALAFASRGIAWSTYLHPDEVAIERWGTMEFRDGYLSNRVYPSGWFELARLKLQADTIFDDPYGFVAHWTTQEGRINAIDRNSFFYNPQIHKPDRISIQSARDFNLFLFALACVFLYATARESGANKATACIPGIILATHPFALENVHYCETDTALIFSLAATCWAGMAAFRRRSILSVFVYAFISGFAFSCKFTLAPFLFLPLVAAFMSAKRSPEERFNKKRFAILLVGTLLLLILGFLVGTPALWRDPSFYLKNYPRISELTYAEGRALIGAYRDRWWAPMAFRFGGLFHPMASLGWPVAVGLLVSIIACLHRKYRTHGLFFPLGLLAFVLFVVFGMPWVRTQECLPIVVLTAAVSHYPLELALDVFREKPLPAVKFRIMACLFAGIIVLLTFNEIRDGFRETSFFVRRETRAECNRWLSTSVTDDNDICIVSGNYVGQAFANTPCRTVVDGYLEEHYSSEFGREFVRTNGVSYYLRNASAVGRRSQRHPFTRELDPEPKASLATFKNESMLLKSWCVSPGRHRPTFAQPDIELWHLRSAIDGEENAPDLPIWFARPILLAADGYNLQEAPGAPLVGPEEALHTVGRRANVRFYADGSPVWAVTRHVAGNQPATIRWDHYALPRHATIEPGHAALFRMDSAALRSAAASDVFPSVRVRMKGDDQTSFCFTSITRDPVEAAFWLRTSGEPNQALNLLRETKILESSPAARIEAFLAAKACGTSPEEAWRQEAERTVETHTSTNTSTIAGLQRHILDDFSRIRLQHVQIFPNLYLPVYLPAGTWRVKIRYLRWRLNDPDLFRLDGLKQNWTETNSDPDGTVEMEASFTLRRGMRLKFAKDIPFTPDLFLESITIEWDSAAQADAAVKEIEKALQ